MTNDELVQQIDAAIEAHGAWKRRLTTAINLGSCEVPPETIACDDQCAFGQWLYGETISDTMKARKPYQVTRRLHAEFHQSAAKVARLAEDGRKGEAYSLMDGEYGARSDTLMRALNKWRGEALPHTPDGA